ncbi:luciferase family protein [Streptomyces inhibens]|uniref:luciferase domain-containing protein n=1 Tax=Streptomyces inhibens TaxID=2293571 RepID=UPI001EE69DBA|nr:luciferase family protein [Streptomyces inhibens]UKY54965.1 DUF5519 family protein [Streptomyces inhibens]
MDLAEHANARLVDRPALSRGRAGCGAQYCLCAGSWEIVHFHSGSEVDVHMTRHMIDRLGPALRGSSALKLPSASGWIMVRLETLSDIDLLATLVSAALLATGSAPGLTEPDRTDRCSQWPRERPTRCPGRGPGWPSGGFAGPCVTGGGGRAAACPPHDTAGPDSDAVAGFWVAVARMAAGMSVRRGVCRCDGPWTAHGFCVLAPGSGRGALIRRARRVRSRPGPGRCGGVVRRCRRRGRRVRRR